MLLKYFSDVFKPFFYLLKRFTAEIIGNVVLKQQGDASADIKHMDNTIVVGRFGWIVFCKDGRKEMEIYDCTADENMILMDIVVDGYEQR